MERKGRLLLSLIILALIAGICLAGCQLYGQGSSKSGGSNPILFPWDPLEWDTLRDSPLLYKSLGDQMDDYPIYESLLKDPSELGFSPDGKYFDTVLSKIKAYHITSVSDGPLLNGCEHELVKLFKEAKIKVTPSLTNYDIEKNFISQVTSHYGKYVNQDVLVFACLRGLLRGLNDPYTNILTPKDYNMLMEKLQEKTFSGIGVYIELDMENSNVLTILEPIEGSPAFKEGMQAGDVIEEIDGESTKNITLDAAVAKLRGPQGSPVKLGVRRKGVKKLLTFKIHRADINVHSVTFKILEDNIGYIRIRMFGTETGHELDAALNNLMSPEEVKGSTPHEKIRSMILDLRNNGGGYLDAAVDVSSRFLPPGSVVFKRLDKNGKIKDFYSKDCEYSKLPLVVLVNRFSASSSEIVTGALKSNKAGTFMGDRTFGKGSVQQIYPLASGSALKLTVSYFLTPEGKIINKKGLRPDILIDMKPNHVGKNGDVQLQKAIEYLKKSGNSPGNAVPGKG